MLIPDEPWSVDNIAWATAICDALGPRRARLFISACCRSFCKGPVPPEIAEAFEVYDRFADTGKTKSAVNNARERMVTHTEYQGKFARLNSNFISADVPRMFREQFGRAYNVVEVCLIGDVDPRVLPRVGFGAEWNLKLDRAGARAHLEEILREFGHPDNGVKFDKRWRTSDVVDLARGIFNHRAFSKMPILADALMDAGCEDEAIIAHCRSGENHYRGCWVLDLILDGNWKEAWDAPKTPAKAKGGKPSIPLTPAQTRQLKKAMGVDARETLEEKITQAYTRGLPDRKADVKDWQRCNELPGRSVEQYQQRHAFLTMSSGEYWLDRGRIRRLALNDPGELAKHASIASRCGYMWFDPEMPPELTACWLLCAIGVHDRAAEKKLLSLPLKVESHTPEGAAYSQAVYSAVRGEWDAIKAMKPIKPDSSYTAGIAHSLTCLIAISQESSELLANGLKARFRTLRSEAKGHTYWTMDLIDVELHGLYELAKRKSPAFAAEFDIARSSPWDADLHQYLQTRTDPWPQIDWSQIPNEIREGIRDLPRPVWWEPEKPTKQ